MLLLLLVIILTVILLWWSSILVRRKEDHQSLWVVVTLLALLYSFSVLATVSDILHMSRTDLADGKSPSERQGDNLRGRHLTLLTARSWLDILVGDIRAAPEAVKAAGKIMYIHTAKLGDAALHGLFELMPDPTMPIRWPQCQTSDETSDSKALESLLP